ncbi:MAG: 5-formyltetrahydrofolate cyclo-ligase [Pseudomonadota bacterium]|uniref:5-formyltetrahydrofolate cyclo-ligase n=1 Tax=Candidatus Desulfatibia profunda TaxID=2841695 RepID=A0A8J6THM4_9BACT|nr:5-formyltetrahydrofolate cyclo-ligase [Candidatus Desulfatibia profunda]MBL7179498.1 5-formyltetrahydrofolate cyclo-ligase [Desulfobacterales bacterium]MBU0698998.1 5-formyltetrahydrofolate cyclo-ligase [Pseudomonadota bacterium]
MEEIRETKEEIRNDIAKRLAALSDSEVKAKTRQIENRLFEFANFLEANIGLLYINTASEVNSQQIIKRCFDYNKIVILPAFDTDTYKMKLMKVDNLDTDLKLGPRGILEPDENRCNVVPIECIDIAIIPGVAFDEKGGRIGSGEGYYDRLIPKLSITTRKVALAFENQIIRQIQMESHDKHVDIIITEKRIIYKI